MKTILISLFAVVTSTWLLDVFATAFPEQSAFLWIARQQGLNLSGLLSIAFMSLTMFLAIRPAWLEKPLGGLDRIYRLHKWSGILAVSFGSLHWLIKQSGGLIKGLIGSDGRLPKIKYDGLLEAMRELGADMGEPALYIALAMLVITLWRRFPYHLWRHLHRIMPVLYLMLVFHAALLAPPAYWTQPVGIVLGLFLILGSVASILSLAGLIGRSRQTKGSVMAIKSTYEVAEITCKLEGPWQTHQPGQFAFITFGKFEGAHPFTIASADRGDQTITFFIKALGDFTRRIAQRIEAGQSVTIEGPYGRFQLDRHNPKRSQIWVAGGVGVTPFLAWLESLQNTPTQSPEADLHYCTRNRDNDHFIGQLQGLCENLPGVRLHVHSAEHGDMLTAESLTPAHTKAQNAEVWFCGPRGLADVLKRGLRESGITGLRFHQEAFELR